jgi:inner membrane protein
MPSPVGHTLAACCLAALAARGGRGAPAAVGAPFVAAMLVAANLPDADFLLGPLLSPLGVALAHQGPTHSIAFVAAAAVAIALAGPGTLRPLRALGWLCAAGAAHLLLDFVSHDDVPPIGLPLFWPLSGAYHHSPVDLFPGTDRDHPFSARNVLELLAELAWTLPPLALLLRERLRRAPLRGRP